MLDRLDDRCLPASGLTPSLLATAYGLDGLTIGGRPADGSGQTIAIVVPGDDPNIQAELATFDARFGLPAPPSLKVIGQNGTAALPLGDNSGGQEAALDVEWAHALAPGASLILVEANSSLTLDLIAAVQTAASQPGVSVVSMSWGGSENFDVSAYDGTFNTPGVTFVAASGDRAGFDGPQWPASSPYVVAIGGTTLQVDANGKYLGESPWYGTSGGVSLIEPEPDYQASVQSSGYRTTPDVAFDADPNTGVLVYSIDPTTGQGGWQIVAGTSLGAPAWSSIVAIADQGRTNAGAGPLSSLQTLRTLYSLPASDFHSFGGYNTVTGLGTPNGPALIQDLVASQASASTTLMQSGNSGTGSGPGPGPILVEPPVILWPILNLPGPTGTKPSPVKAKSKHHHKAAHAKPVHPQRLHPHPKIAPHPNAHPHARPASP